MYETKLASSAVLTGVQSEPCRVCGEPIWLGDPCLARAWHVGFAHLACGWYTPADLSFHEREAMHRAARGEGLSKEQWATLVRGSWARNTSGQMVSTDRGDLVLRHVKEIIVNTKEAS